MDRPAVMPIVMKLKSVIIPVAVHFVQPLVRALSLTFHVSVRLRGSYALVMRSPWAMGNQLLTQWDEHVGVVSRARCAVLGVERVTSLIHTTNNRRHTPTHTPHALVGNKKTQT